MKTSIIIASAAIILMSCSSDRNPTESELMNEKSDTTQAVSVSREVLDDMIQTLPSPIETANLITQSESVFNRNLLIPSKNSEMFQDKYSQALAMGGYGVDLGYLNLNNKILYVAEYLESINTISQELKVNQFLDFKVLNNLAKNRNNVDSLIRISTENFNQIDEYLRTQNRGDLSVLILVGTWIEGLHMFNHIAKANPSPEITKRIGEQKIIIDNIYAILNKIENINYYKELKNKLTGLKTVFNKVTITYVYKEPEMKEVDGQLIVVDGSQSVVKVSDQDLVAIDREITLLRNSIFKINP